MDISLVGTASANNTNGTNLTVTLPGGVAQDDVVFAAYGNANSSDFDVTTVTSGYTELADLYSNDSLDANFGVFRKVQGASPDSTVVFTGGGASNTGAAAVAMVLRGVNTTTPEDATTTTATGIDSAIPDPPSITTVTADAWVLAFGGSSRFDTSVNAPTNYTNFESDSGDSISDFLAMVASREIAVPGAEDPGTFQNVGTSTSSAWCAVTVAVRPLIQAGSFIFAPNPMLPLLVR